MYLNKVPTQFLWLLLHIATWKVLLCQAGWIRRLAFPPDTTLDLKPLLTIPLFNSDDNNNVDGKIEIALPLKKIDRYRESSIVGKVILKIEPISNGKFLIVFTVKFDDLGWPLPKPGALFFPNSGVQLMPRRGRRDISGMSNRNSSTTTADMDAIQQGKHAHANSSPAGDRANFFLWIIKSIRKLGLDGKGCILRATCEIHQDSLDSYGLLGEMITLLFSVSTSALSEVSDFKEFLHAEKMGKRKNCRAYYNQCQLSVFQWHKY